MARPVHTPDPALRRQVEAMAGYGIPELGIAKVIGIDPKTLRKHYRSELDLGHIKANSAVAQSLFKKGDRRRPAVGDRGDLLGQDPNGLEGDDRQRAWGCREQPGQDQRHQADHR